MASPDKGTKISPFRSAEIASHISALGVAPGSVLMVHASLRAIGKVEGGADGVLDAIASVLGPAGTLLMLLGARDDFSWVSDKPEGERAALLANTEPFDPATTPAEPHVGYLAEAFRRRAGTKVSNNPEGRFAASGARADELLADAPWDHYFGPGSPLERLCAAGGKVLRIGADPDTTTLLHWAEYLVPLPHKRRVRRHRRVLGPDGPIIRTVDCLNDSTGIVAYEGEDYFGVILGAYLALGRAPIGKIGNAQSHLLDARAFTAFGVGWMANNLG